MGVASTGLRRSSMCQWCQTLCQHQKRQKMTKKTSFRPSLRFSAASSRQTFPILEQSALGLESGLRPRHGEEEMVFRSLFWCATEVDPSGYVKEWGQCNVGCKADPAGSYVPAAPRRGTSTSKDFIHSLRGQTVGQLAAIIRAANQRNRGPN